MKTQTDKEKLEKCLEFIKKIENIKYTAYDIPLIDIEEQFKDEGNFSYVNMNTESIKMTNAEYLENLKNSAWHLLADIS